MGLLQLPLLPRVLCLAVLLQQTTTTRTAAISSGPSLRDAPIAGPTPPSYLDTASGLASWTATSADEETIPVTVPGDIISDLHAAGRIGNPLFELNFKNSSVWDQDWSYTASFPTPPAMQQPGLAPEVLLVFDGIKMGAQVAFNGHILGRPNDQFLRFNFSVGPLLLPAGSNNTLNVSFDWAPYSNQKQEGAATFSKGIWKSVYLVAVPAVAVTHLVPLVFYDGPYPSAPLTDATKGDFHVAVTAHLWASKAGAASFVFSGAWGQQVRVADHAFPGGSSSVAVTLRAPSAAVRLWWPIGAGAQPLYACRVNVSHSTGTISVARQIGFRSVALVTGNDTDPAYVQRAQHEEGTELHGMFFRINGALIFCRGANMIPMDEMEGWLHGGAHVQTVRIAAASNFNMLRVWGGGMYLPDVWYEECDRLGILVFHDVMYAQKGHAPNASAVQDAELRHQVRRLSHHPSIVLYDGCNECVVNMQETTSIYATFVIRVIAAEDASRVVWPSCPAKGWTTGVHKLTGLPNGNAFATPDTTLKRCTDVPGAQCIEVHRPKWQGSGWPAVNGHRALTPGHSNDPWPYNFFGLFPSNIPLHLEANRISPALRNNFSSESPGATAMSSFESMSATLLPEHWGLHANEPPNVAANTMSQRNYPCDSFVLVYFGRTSNVNATGERAFKQQLYQCMLAQALVIKQNIELTRSQNRFGTLVWQFNEIWPTGGWGSIEYGNPNFPGQVIGGRWKPLQHWYKASIYADVMATCDGAGLCYVRNDGVRPFEGRLVINVTAFADGTAVTHQDHALSLPAGAGATEWLQVPTLGQVDGTRQIVEAVVQDADGATVSHNVIPFATPEHMQLPAAHVTVTAQRGADGSLVAVVDSKALAIYVTLTTLAPGWFEDNAFVMGPGQRRVVFVPVDPMLLVPRDPAADFALFESSLRVEDLSLYRS